MGRSIAIVYTVEITLSSDKGRPSCTPSEWRSRKRGQAPGYGKPNAANLAQYVSLFEGSTQPGQCNAHLGIQKVASARIIHQATKAVVATYTQL